MPLLLGCLHASVFVDIIACIYYIVACIAHSLGFPWTYLCIMCILPYPTVSGRIPPYLAVNCRVLPYPAAPCRIVLYLPYPAVSCRILPYLAVWLRSGAQMSQKWPARNLFASRCSKLFVGFIVIIILQHC